MASDPTMPYRVLARKYRPQNFADLIGQDALVRTLTNAIQSGRIAQAYMLTGIRGVGKTTTARIIAKALNYKDGPTVAPTDDCTICKAISEDRHPDVLEMDAASHTGVDNMREILDGVRYAPTEARYKVYIIDEVHMLSKQAFNALLKTLEEPPSHVIFIFATTEIRKVPVTILSRCQRFDLRRIEGETLSNHYKKICGLENVEIDDEALTMITRAADGSVRDGLSLLDQAIAMSEGKVTAEQVRSMLGLADQSRVTDLLEKILKGEVKEVLEHLDHMYAHGAEPLVLVQDLLDQVHILTRFRAVPGENPQHLLAADQTERLQKMAGEASMPALARVWQMLLKGLQEVQQAPRPQTALEMLMIRICHMADMPDPADLLKKIQSGEMPSSPSPSSPPSVGSPDGAGNHAYARTGNGTYESMPATSPQSETVAQADPKTLEEIVSLLEAGGKFALASQVVQYVRLVRIKEHKLEIADNPEAPSSIPNDLTNVLRELTPHRWFVISTQGAVGQPTIKERAEAARMQEINQAKEIPVVAEVFKIFPNADITGVYNVQEGEE
jgi:DNA polymerase III subunit gamma/tau